MVPMLNRVAPHMKSYLPLRSSKETTVGWGQRKERQGAVIDSKEIYREVGVKE